MRLWAAFCILMTVLYFGSGARQVLIHFGQKPGFSTDVGMWVGLGTLGLIASIATLTRVIVSEKKPNV
jgi:hypothetical protein